MKIKKSILALCFSLAVLSLFAQKDETLFGKSGLRLTGAWGGTHLGLTKFSDDFTAFSGGYGGLEFNKSIFLGWGSYNLINDAKLDIATGQNFEMDYNGLIIGYAYRADKVVHPTLNILAGRGKVQVDSEDITDRIYAVQPAIGVEINVFKWFRIGVEGGYRFVMETDLPNLSDSDLSSPYGKLQLKFGYSWGRSKKRLKEKEEVKKSKKKAETGSI